MRKRIFSMLLALCLMLSLLPTAALATEGDAGDTEGTGGTTQAVAQIGDQTYTDFASALNAASSGDTIIKLLADVSTETLPCNNMTYDLNGKTLTYSSGKAVAPTGNQTLKFMDSSVSGATRGGTLNLSGVAGTNAALNPKTGGTVTAENINVSCNGSAFFPAGDAAAVNVTNCDVTSAVYCVATNAGTNANYNVVITLKDSTFKTTANDGDDCAVMINVPGSLIIDNCEITGDRQAVMVRAGEATITNSKITATGNYSDSNDYENTKQWGSGNEVPMAAIVVGSQTSAYKADAVCSITDTEISAPSAEGKEKPAVYVSSNSKTNSEFKSQLNISGEETKITGDVVVADGTETTPASVIIKDRAAVDGNITNHSAASAVAVIDGATLTGEATVTEGNTSASNYIESTETEESTVIAVNTMTAKPYTDLASAISSAEKGDTIRLVKDFTLDAPESGLISGQGAINITKNLTIDGNGKEITAGANFSKNASDSRGEYHIINIMDGANVTIQNLTIDGQSTTDNSTPRSGINIFTADNASDKTTVLLETVTVKNCSTYGVTCGGSVLSVTDITTENNAWGGINVDNTSSSATGATFTMNSGTIKEDNSIFIENSKSVTSGLEITIHDGTFNGTVSIAKDNNDEDISGVTPVSYTHLTLPTILRV